MLRRMAGSRPPQHSYERKRAGFGVQHLAFSLEYPLGLDIGQSFDTTEGLEAASRGIPDQTKHRMRIRAPRTQEANQ